MPIYRSGAGDIETKDSGYQRIPKQTRVDAVKKRILESEVEGEAVNTDAFVDNINLNLRSKIAEKTLAPLIKNKEDFGDVFSFDYNPV